MDERRAGGGRRNPVVNSGVNRILEGKIPNAIQEGHGRSIFCFPLPKEKIHHGVFTGQKEKQRPQKQEIPFNAPDHTSLR
jgi:hypothetical protein